MGPSFLCQMEDVAIASLPQGKLKWLNVLLQHNMLKAEALLLLQDVKDTGALLGKLEKQFPLLKVAMAKVRLLTWSHRAYDGACPGIMLNTHFSDCFCRLTSRQVAVATSAHQAQHNAQDRGRAVPVWHSRFGRNGEQTEFAILVVGH